MKTVHERIDVFPFTSTPLITVERREDLLLTVSAAPPGGRLREHPPIEAVHFGATYVEQAFAPPRGVFESATVRVEWQNMNARQPFYHRNCGVDEISFQVCGERTLITELGTTELRPGDFSRIPDGIAHDNYGRQDIHLLFYVPGGAAELLAPTRTTAYLAEPFPGWRAAVIPELTTEGVGGPGQDLMFTPVDEQMLIDAARAAQTRIQILHPQAAAQGVQWLYRNEHICLGRHARASDQGTVYVRHRDADEIQYQVAGHRTLVTQRGAIRLVPGDFVCIPRGVAFTSIHGAPSEHLILASRSSVPQVAPANKRGVRLGTAELDALRGQP